MDEPTRKGFTKPAAGGGIVFWGRAANRGGFYDLCALAQMATELAIAMMKNRMAPSRKVL